MRGEEYLRVLLFESSDGLGELWRLGGLPDWLALSEGFNGHEQAIGEGLHAAVDDDAREDRRLCRMRRRREGERMRTRLAILTALWKVLWGSMGSCKTTMTECSLSVSAMMNAVCSDSGSVEQRGRKRR